MKIQTSLIPVIRTNPEHQRLMWLYGGYGMLLLVVGAYVLPVLAVMLTTENEDSRQGLLSMISVVGVNVSYIALILLIARSLRTDFHNRFWDQLRMSSLSPWQLTWPRLFSAPLMAWVGLLVGYFLQNYVFRKEFSLLFMSGMSGDTEVSLAVMMWLVAIALLLALILAAWVLINCVQFNRPNTEWNGRLPQVFLLSVLLGGWQLIAGVGTVAGLEHSFDTAVDQAMGSVFSFRLFLTGWVLINAALSVLCACRVMANRLHMVPVNLFWLGVILLYPLLTNVYLLTWFPGLPSMFLPLALNIYGAAALVSLATQNVRPLPRGAGWWNLLNHMPVWYVMLPLAVVLTVVFGSTNGWDGAKEMAKQEFFNHFTVWAMVYLLLYAGCKTLLRLKTSRFNVPTFSMLLFGVLYTTFAIFYLSAF